MARRPTTKAPVRPEHAEVAKFVDERVKRGFAVVERYRKIGMLNEQFVLGNQWGATTWTASGPRVDKNQWFESEGVPRLHVNLLANLRMTWAALVTKDRQSARATQATEEPEDAYRAELTNKLIEWIAREFKTMDVFMQAAQYGCEHGLAGVKHVYDVKNKTLSIAPLTIFNVLLDPKQPDYKKSRSFIFQNYLDPEEAEAMYEAQGIKRKPKVETYKNAAEEQLEGVVHNELWQLPCREYPDGMFASVVDGECIEVIDQYPYRLEIPGQTTKLVRPLSVFKVRNIRESAYGATNLTECVPLQRGYNEIVARLMKLMRKTTNATLVAPAALKKHFNPDIDSVMWVPNAAIELAKEIKYVQGMAPSQALYDLRDFFKTSMYEVMGINEITAGAKTRSISGRAIQNIVELDAQKNADATKSFEAMVLDVIESCINLVRIFFAEPRKMKLMNGTREDVFWFDRADVQGDIHLEPSSEIDQFEDVKKNAIGEQQKLGVAGPLDLAKGTKSPSYGAARDTAEALVTAYMGGAELPDGALDDVTPEVLLEVIGKHKARALAGNRKADWLALHALEQQVGGLDRAPVEAAPPARAPTPEPQPPGAPQ